MVVAQIAKAAQPIEQRAREEAEAMAQQVGLFQTIAEQQAEIKVADGYALNLFASEVEFPDLKNPVQIAAEPYGLVERPGAIGIQRDPRVGKALGQRGVPYRLPLLMRMLLSVPSIAVIEALQPYSGVQSLLLVGHEPNLGELVTTLISAKYGSCIMFKKAGLCRLEADALRPGRAILHWLLTPAQMLGMR